MSANTAMNVFMRAVVETRSIPFSIGKKRDTRQEFGDILNAMHQAAIERDFGAHLRQKIMRPATLKYRLEDEMISDFVIAFKNTNYHELTANNFRLRTTFD